MQDPYRADYPKSQNNLPQSSQQKQQTIDSDSQEWVFSL